MRHTGPEIRQASAYTPPSAEVVSGVFRSVHEQSPANTAELGPASARQLSKQLHRDLGSIKRACELLEAHGVITKAWTTQSRSSPRYRITPEGQWATQADAQTILDYTHRSLAEVVAQSWTRNFGMTLRLTSLAIGAWEYTDEDVTAFACAAGQAEGNVAFSLDRGFLLKSLAHVGGHGYRSLNISVRKYFGTLIEKVADDVGREIAAAGFDVALSSGVAIAGRGTLLSNPRDVRYLIDLTNRYGRLRFRLTLRDSVKLSAT